MASEVEIANRALSKLGDNRITSLTDQNKAARAIAAAWNIVRDAELRRHPWSFALQFQDLSALTEPSPTSLFKRQFQLPVDCLRLYRVGTWFVWQVTVGADYRNADIWPFKIAGRRILTDLPAPLPIAYIRRVEDTQQWDATFVDAFACKLAMEVAVELSGSDTRQDRLREQYKDAILDARAMNAIELPPEQLPDNSWVLSRIGP